MSETSILSTGADKRNDKSKVLYPALGAGMCAVTMVISGLTVALPYWIQFDETVRTSANGVAYDVSIKFTHGLWSFCNVVTARGQTTEKCGKIQSFSDSDVATQCMIVMSIIMCLCTVIQLVLYLSKLRQLSGQSICLYIGTVTSVISELLLVSGVTVFGISDHDIKITDTVSLKFSASKLYVSFWLAVVGCLTNTACVVFLLLTIYTNRQNKKKEATSTVSTRSSLNGFDSPFNKPIGSSRDSTLLSEESSDSESDDDYLTRHPHPHSHPKILTPSNLAFRFSESGRTKSERSNVNSNVEEKVIDKQVDVSTVDKEKEKTHERSSTSNGQGTSEKQGEKDTHHQYIGSGFIPESVTTKDGKARADDKEVCESKMSEVMNEILSEPVGLQEKDGIPHSARGDKPVSGTESNSPKTNENLPKDNEASVTTRGSTETKGDLYNIANLSMDEKTSFGIKTPPASKMHGKIENNNELDHTAEQQKQPNTSKNQIDKATRSTDSSAEPKEDTYNMTPSIQPVQASGWVSLPQDTVQDGLDKGETCKEEYPISLEDEVGCGEPPIDTREYFIPAILTARQTALSFPKLPPVFSKVETGTKRPRVAERHTYHNDDRVKSVYGKADLTIPQYPEKPRKQRTPAPPVLKKATLYLKKSSNEPPPVLGKATLHLKKTLPRTDSDC